MAGFTEPNLLVPELLNERQESVIAELAKRLEQSSADRRADCGSSAINGQRLATAGATHQDAVRRRARTRRRRDAIRPAVSDTGIIG